MIGHLQAAEWQGRGISFWVLLHSRWPQV